MASSGLNRVMIFPCDAWKAPKCSCYVVSDSLWPHGLQLARLLCPPLSPGVCSNSWPLSQWHYLTISSSATPFSSCPQSFSASGSFPMSQLFSSGGQSLELQFSTSPFSEYSGLISRIDWFDLFAVQGALKSVLQNRSAKASMLWCSAFLIVQLSQPYMTTGKIIALTIRTFVSRVYGSLLAK